VPDTVPANYPPALTRVLSAARVALDDVPADPALAPLEAVIVIRSLARVVEDGLRQAVQLARQAGHTWAEIGELLGTSRQAAFQRFGRPAVRVELGQEAPYAQLLVSVDDAEGTVAAIRGATGL